MVLAIGFFDGIHLGHQAILAGADAVLTFRNHPASVLAPHRAPCLLMDAEERLAGLPNVTALDFTRELADEEPDAFVSWLRATYPELTAVRCGPNWRFGRGGRGDAALLRAAGIEVQEVPFAQYAGEPVSSTRIRSALASGDLAAANAMLGRPYAVTGTVVSGKGVGRSIGFPTVNVDPGRPLCLRRGVYAVDTPFGRGIANYGTAPTAGTAAWRTPVVEVNVVDGLEELEKFEQTKGAPCAEDRHNGGGRRPRRPVSFLKFIRDERCFASYEELAAQIALDLKAAQ